MLGIPARDGQRVWVRVSSAAFDDKARLEEVIAVITRENDRLLDAVVDDLLEDKNESWLEDDEDPLTEAEFRRKLKLAAIEIGPGGEIELVLDDSGMMVGAGFEPTTPSARIGTTVTTVSAIRSAVSCATGWTSSRAGAASRLDVGRP